MTKKYASCAEAAAAQKFTSGDVVYLNSGGPQMTVVDVIDRYVDIVWFDRESVLHELQLPEDCLRKPTAAESEVPW